MTNHKYGFLIDASRCIDCRACMMACSVQNNVPMEHTRIWMKDTGIVGEYPDLKHYTAIYHCMHVWTPPAYPHARLGRCSRTKTVL